MPKFDMTVQLKKNTGENIGPALIVPNATSRTAAEAIIAAEIANRANSASASAQELLDCQAQFAS
jgi:hypothetical protein